jgi:hypothetical protein
MRNGTGFAVIQNFSSSHPRNNAELMRLNTHRGAGTKEFLKVRDQVNRVILSIAVLLGSDP